MPKFKDIKGLRFGRLTAIEYVSGTRSRKSKWVCKCDCGSIKAVITSNLINGKTKSCGCLASESVANRNKKHGMRYTPEYKTWSAMINRCNNKSATRYENYGGRGIKVCDSWLDFLSFYADMGEQPSGYSIERIDVDKGYSKSNCKWIKTEDQAANKRVFKNNKSGVKGVTISKGLVVAHWYQNGKQKRKYFSINKYGFDVAFLKAKDERDKQIKNLINKGKNYGKYK